MSNSQIFKDLHKGWLLVALLFTSSTISLFIRNVRDRELTISASLAVTFWVMAIETKIDEDSPFLLIRHWRKVWYIAIGLGVVSLVTSSGVLLVSVLVGFAVLYVLYKAFEAGIIHEQYRNDNQ